MAELPKDRLGASSAFFSKAIQKGRNYEKQYSLSSLVALSGLVDFYRPNW